MDEHSSLFARNIQEEKSFIILTLNEKKFSLKICKSSDEIHSNSLGTVSGAHTLALPTFILKSIYLSDP